LKKLARAGSVIDVRGELDGAVIFARGAFSYEVSSSSYFEVLSRRDFHHVAAAFKLDVVLANSWKINQNNDFPQGGLRGPTGGVEVIGPTYSSWFILQEPIHLATDIAQRAYFLPRHVNFSRISFLGADIKQYAYLCWQSRIRRHFLD